MNLATVDLNLLRALLALLEQRSVTRAAEQLGISQPSMSAALGRLRRHFDDQLLVRHGRQSRLTPLGLQLLDRARLALGSAERVFGSQAGFDPTTSRREYHLVMSDHETALFGHEVAALLAQEAPRTRLHVTMVTARLVQSVPDSLLESDLFILPHGVISEVPHQDLYVDEWQCIVWSANSAVGERVTVENLRTLPWVLSYDTPTASTTVARAIRMLGIDMRVQVVLESLLTVPGMITGTDRIAVLPRSLIERLPAGTGLRALACPFDPGPFREAMWWHPSYDDDPEHTFLRDVVTQATAPLRRAALGGDDQCGLDPFGVLPAVHVLGERPELMHNQGTATGEGPHHPPGEPTRNLSHHLTPGGQPGPPDQPESCDRR